MKIGTQSEHDALVGMLSLKNESYWMGLAASYFRVRANLPSFVVFLRHGLYSVRLYIKGMTYLQTVPFGFTGFGEVSGRLSKLSYII